MPKRKPRYPLGVDVVQDGVPQWWPKTITLSCCDCGLAHRMEIKPIRGMLQVTMTRQPLITARYRRAARYPMNRRGR